MSYWTMHKIHWIRYYRLDGIRTTLEVRHWRKPIQLSMHEPIYISFGIQIAILENDESINKIVINKQLKSTQLLLTMIRGMWVVAGSDQSSGIVWTFIPINCKIIALHCPNIIRHIPSLQIHFSWIPFFWIHYLSIANVMNITHNKIRI